MAGPARKIRIFLSSPGDVAPERERAKRIIEALSAEFEATGSHGLEAINWPDQWFTAARHFQEGLPDPADCDLVVCLFWKRLGTPLPERFARADGTQPSGTEWEFERALEGARRSAENLPDILVYRKTARIYYDAESVELEQAQKRALDAFWQKWFRSEEGHFLAAFKSVADSDAFARELESDLRRWVADRRRGLRWSIEQNGSPFRGLAAFEERHAPIFFGRRRQVEQARARLIAAAEGEGTLPFLLILGMSGAGKSSMLRAGLIPLLLHPGSTPRIAFWRRLVTTPASLGGEPFEALARALLGDDVLPELRSGDFAKAAALGRLFRSAPDASAQPIVAALDRWSGALAAKGGDEAPPATGLLLGIDQLEELFAWPAESRDAFLSLLVALLESGRVWVAATLRSDFYPLLQGEPQLFALKERGRSFDLAPPGEAALTAIITEPAEAAGLAYERDPATGESLADLLIAEAGGVNALPLLQFALQRLFEERDAASGLLRLASYRAMGGLPGAIEGHAETTLRAVSAEEQAALPEVLRELATVGETKDAPVTARRARLAAFAAGSPARRLVDALIAARLVSAEDDGAGAQVRVAHEALFTHWGRAASVIEASREELALRQLVERQAAGWLASGQPGEDLLRGGRLLQAEELIRRSGSAGFDDGMRAFVAASSLASRRESLRRRNRLMAVIASLSILLALAVGIAVYAFRQEDSANRARAEAEAQRSIAEAERAEAETQRHLAETQTNTAEAERKRAEEQTVIAQQSAALAEARRSEAEESLRIATESIDAVLVLIFNDLWNTAGLSRAKILGLLEQAEARFSGLLPAGGELSPELLRVRSALTHMLARAYMELGDLEAAKLRAEASVADARQLAAHDPDNANWQRDLSVSLARAGEVLLAGGDLAGALAAYEESLAIRRDLVSRDPTNAVLQLYLSSSLKDLGDVRQAQGDLAGALAAYVESVAVARDLVARDPGSASSQSDLSGALDRVGDVLQVQGDLAGALAAYNESLAIRRDLAAGDPGDSGWQRDLSAALDRVGDVRRAQGDLAGSLSAYEESLAIRRGLVARDPDNASWQFALGVSLDRVGDVRLAQGDLVGALASYQESLAIARDLAERDPGNTGWQLGLSVSLERVGDLRRAQDDLVEALAAYGESLGILRDLVARDPGNTHWRSNQSAVLKKVGDALEAQGDLAGALTAYEESLAIARELVSRDPSNAVWQLDLSIGLDRVGNLQQVQGDLAGALSAYEESLAIRRALAARDPGNTDWQRNLSISLNKVGDVRQAQGDLAGALAAYEESLAIARELAARDPGNPGWQSGLSASLDRVGDVRQAQGDTAGALAAYEESLAIRRDLVARDPGRVDWQLDLVVSLYSIGTARPDPGLLKEALAILQRLHVDGVLPPANESWMTVIADALLKATVSGQ